MQAPKGDYKWMYIGGGCLLGALMLSRGGLAELAPLIRLAWPVLVVIFIYRYAKSKIKVAAEKILREAQGGGFAPPQQRRSSFEGAGPVIDLCPKCGSYLKPGHRCK